MPELEQVMVLADSIDQRYLHLVPLAVFASLRWGELMGLRKADFDLVDGLVRVERSIVLIGAEQVSRRPRWPPGCGRWRSHGGCSRWSRRTPGLLRADRHGAVFVGLYGKAPARPKFSPIWRRAIAAADLPGLHFHDRGTRVAICRRVGCEHARADGPNGACECRLGTGLPACDRRARPDDCRFGRMLTDLVEGTPSGSGHGRGPVRG